MSNIYLIRHGQASFNADDYDNLSTLGIQQASLLGRSLSDKGLLSAVVIRGSMLRHQQTANHSLSSFNDEVTIIEDSRWNEYDHQNILGVYKTQFATPQGIKQYLADEPSPMRVFKRHFIAAIKQWMTSENDDRYTESWQAFNHRVTKAMADIAQRYQGKTVLVYTSGGPISLIACSLLGLPEEQFMTINWSLVNAGVTKVINPGVGAALSLSTLNEHDIFERQHDKALITYT